MKNNVQIAVNNRVVSAVCAPGYVLRGLTRVALRGLGKISNVLHSGGVLTTPAVQIVVTPPAANAQEQD